LRLSLGLSLKRRGGSNPFASYALALDFDDQQYWSGGTQAASLSALSGYTFTRSGTQGAIDSDNSIDSFVANVPAINGNGYHAYGALTNLLLRSQEFDNASWGNYASASVTANTSTAPDGATTADTLTFASDPTSEVFQNVSAASATYAVSVWAKVASGARAFRIKVYDGVGNNYSSDFTATTSWQRFTYIHTGAVNNISIANAAAGGTGSIYAWQAQMLAGNFPDGGPIIVTAGSTAAIGASALSTTTNPITSEQDFVLWAAATLGPASDNKSNFIAILGEEATYGPSLVREWTGGGSVLRARVGSTTLGADGPAFPSAGRVVLLLRRRAGKWTFAYKLPSGTVTVTTEGGATAFPTITSRFGIGLGANDTDGVVEGAFIRTGTFSDAEIEAILESA
jgi:hypothetical protein